MKTLFLVLIMLTSMLAIGQTGPKVQTGVKLKTPVINSDTPVTVKGETINRVMAIGDSLKNLDQATYKIADAQLGYTKAQVDSVALLKIDKTVGGITLLKDNTQHSLSNTNVATTIYTGTIPANTLASGGKLIFENLISFTGSTNAKTIRVKINGTDVGYFSTSTAANIAAQNTYRLWLRSGNVQISQSAVSNASNGFTVGTVSLATYSFNYTEDWTVTVAVTMASSAETTSLESFSVVYFP